MAIITISNGSYSKSKEVAEKLAEKLGYEFLSRNILLEASEHFNVPEIKLARALEGSPSILERITNGKERYRIFLQNALLEHIRKDNVVYYGIAGHFFLQHIPHILKVRIIAGMEEDDQERRRWILHAHGIDNVNPELYDMVLHVDNMDVDDIVDILADTATKPCYRITSESKRAIENLYLTTKIQATLMEKSLLARVQLTDDTVNINVESLPFQKAEVSEEIGRLLSGINGIKKLNVEIAPVIVPD